MKSDPSIHLSRICRSGLVAMATAVLWLPGTSRCAEAEPGEYDLRFSLVAMAPEAGTPGDSSEEEDLAIRGIRFLAGGEAREIPRVPLHTRTSQYLYRGSGPLVFFREETDASGNVSHKELARVAIDPAWKSVIILVFPDTVGAPGGFRTFVVGDDPDSFPLNSMQVVNMTASELGWKLGEDVLRVKPGEVNTSAVDIDTPRMMPVRFAVQMANEAGWEEVFSTSLPFRGTQRFLCLVPPAPDDDARPLIPPILINDFPHRNKLETFDLLDENETPTE